MWKRVTDSLKLAGTLRDGFLVTAAVFYFFGYIVWSINAYQDNLGLLPALEFQYLVAGAPPVFIILALCSIVTGARLFNYSVRTWIGTAPTGLKLYLSWVMSLLGLGALVLIFVGQASWFRVAFRTVDRSWLLIIVVFIIVVAYPFLRPLPAARQPDPPTKLATARQLLQQVLISILRSLLDSGLGFLRILYAIYVPVILIMLAALAFLAFLQLYPKIPQEFGGARPRDAFLDVVKAQLSTQTSEDILPIDVTRSDDPVVRSAKIEILFSGSDVTLVRARGRVHRITNRLIQAVRLLPPQKVIATEIAAQKAKDAFAAFLDPKVDHDSMQAYSTSIVGARNRQDLGIAWKQIPGLAGKGATFLEDHVFAKATAEAEWPQKLARAQLEPAFVAGVQEAVAGFLRQGV